MICISHRDDDIRCRFLTCRIIVDNIAQLGEDDACKLLFQKLIRIFLKILVDRKIYVISCFRLCPAHRVCYFSKVVYIDGRLAFFALEDTVKRLLKT